MEFTLFIHLIIYVFIQRKLNWKKFGILGELVRKDPIV